MASVHTSSSNACVQIPKELGATISEISFIEMRRLKMLN